MQIQTITGRPLWHYHLFQSEQYIKQCEELFARHIRQVEKTHAHGELVIILNKLTGTYQRTIQIARSHHATHAAMFIRSLRMSVMRRYSERGRLLIDAKRISDASFRAVLHQNDISLPEAMNCMTLYLHWREFVKTERRNCINGRQTPSTLEDAISLLHLSPACS